jgi:hypothetical protein
MNGYHIEQRNEIPPDQAQGYEAPEPGQCYCHLTMHAEHYPKRPCHHCEEEVAREFIAWCESDEREDQLREQREQEFYELGPLDVIQFEEWLNRNFGPQPCAPRSSMERISA